MLCKAELSKVVGFSDPSEYVDLCRETCSKLTGEKIQLQWSDDAGLRDGNNCSVGLKYACDPVVMKVQGEQLVGHRFSGGKHHGLGYVGQLFS